LTVDLLMFQLDSVEKKQTSIKHYFVCFVYFVYIYGINLNPMEALIEKTTRKEQKIALDNLPMAKRLAKSFAKRSDPVSIQVSDHGVVTLNLPAKLFGVLQEILDLMSKGKAFSLLPANAELTTQEAADLLNVSRPFIVKLIEQGTIPVKRVGTHRRIFLEDVLSYGAKMHSDREEGLKELARLGQKYNM